MDHIELWLVIGCDLVGIGVAYGVISTRVTSIENQYKQFMDDYRSRHTELIDEIKMIRNRIQELADRMVK